MDTGRSRWLAFPLMLLLAAGCSYDPEETVTIEITGVKDKDHQKKITEKLKGMTDGSSHSMTFSSAGETLTVKLAPVGDVEAFSKKIDFGTVKTVRSDTRTVTVVIGGDPRKVDPSDQQPDDKSKPRKKPSTPKTSSNSKPAAKGYDSPKAAFAALQKAFQQKDWKGVLKTMDAESRKNLAGTLVLMGGFMSLDEDDGPKVVALLKKHGLVGAKPKGDPNKDIKVLAEPIKDIPAFVSDMLTFIDKHADKPGALPFTRKGKLTELKVTGETASAKFVAEIDGRKDSKPVEFRKIEGRWFVHFTPESMGGPGGPAGKPAPSSNNDE